MCYNATISIISYVVGIVGCRRLFNQNYLAETLFYLVVCSMQLFEFFIHMNPYCGNINYQITKIGIAINHLEPVALYIGIKFQRTSTKFLDYMMYLYSPVAFFYTVHAWNTSQCTQITEYSYPHLHWAFNQIYGSIMFYAFFLTVLVLLSLIGLRNGSDW